MEMSYIKLCSHITTGENSEIEINLDKYFDDVMIMKFKSFHFKVDEWVLTAKERWGKDYNDIGNYIKNIFNEVMK